jgi:DNA recombination protein RmuC
MTGNTSLFVFIIVILLLNAVILWRLFRGEKGSGEQPANGDGLLLIQNQVNALTKTLDSKLSENSDRLHRTLQHQSSESVQIIRDITEKLTRLDETNKQVISFTDQLKSLQDILKNPKQRGVLGEYYLETLLKNILSPSDYQMQYAFNDGTIVDAAVFVNKKIIPIDSKFSLENYNRMIEAKDQTERERLQKIFENDLKQRIVETSKYILPEEGTMDFAFMFIPHEAIYYDLLIGKVGLDENENLIQRAAGKYKVIIVSPTSFLAYLQTVLQGLRALHIEEKAKDIIKRVGDLSKHLKTFDDYHMKIGNSLGTVVSHFNASRKEFGKIDKDITRLDGETMDIEPLVLDKPTVDTD